MNRVERARRSWTSPLVLILLLAAICSGQAKERIQGYVFRSDAFLSRNTC